MSDDIKPSKYEDALWSYIETIETVNQSMLEVLRGCVKEMTAVKKFVPDPIGWQEVLDLLNDTIDECEKLSWNRKLH